MAKKDSQHPRSLVELSANEKETFAAALKLVQQHLEEIRGLGYIGPEPSSYNPETDTMFDPEVGVVMFSFPESIEGALAGSANWSSHSIWLATSYWISLPWESDADTEKRVARTVAHELLHVWPESSDAIAFHDEGESDSSTDRRLHEIFGTKTRPKNWDRSRGQILTPRDRE